VLIVTGEARRGDDDALTSTRGTVQDVTEQRRIEHALRRSEERRQEEHAAVQILQAAILPNELPSIPGASVVARYVAASENVAVGGDFYDVFVLDDERVLLTVGDVAGKGVQAAEAVGQLRNGLRMAAVIDPDPMAMVASLNALVGRGFKAPFATAVVGVYRPADGRLEWASAGHLPLVVRRASGACELVGVDPTHPPVGVSGQVLAPASSLTLAPGDGVLLFTDGLIERRDEDLGTSLDDLVRAVAEGPLDPAGLVAAVLGRSVGSGVLQDDVCVLALTRSERRARPDRGWSSPAFT
jgi:serine phosphatase RsbU (regulator of sigma subunit)